MQSEVHKKYFRRIATKETNKKKPNNKHTVQQMSESKLIFLYVVKDLPTDAHVVIVFMDCHSIMFLQQLLWMVLGSVSTLIFMIDFIERVFNWMLGLWGCLKSCRPGLVWHAAHGFIWHTRVFSLSASDHSAIQREPNTTIQCCLFENRLRMKPICLWEMKNDGVCFPTSVYDFISGAMSCHVDTMMQKLQHLFCRLWLMTEPYKCSSVWSSSEENEGRHIYSLAAFRQCLCC